MQVFVPFPDLKQSVRCLDPSRLGNQIYRECLTIINVLRKGPTTPSGRPTGWYNHPATQMWWNHQSFLCEYAFAGLDELSHRGLHYPEIFDKFHAIKLKVKDTGPPIWWGDERVHLSHQSNLLAKDEEHYSRFFPDAPRGLEYYWPSFPQKEIVQHGNRYIRRHQQQS